MARRKAAPRELIDTGTDKRYVRGDSRGRFAETERRGSLTRCDWRRKVETKAAKEQGDSRRQVNTALRFATTPPERQSRSSCTPGRRTTHADRQRSRSWSPPHDHSSDSGYSAKTGSCHSLAARIAHGGGRRPPPWLRAASAMSDFGCVRGD